MPGRPAPHLAGAEYQFAEPTGDWLADRIGIGQQARLIMRRHPWLATLVITRPSSGRGHAGRGAPGVGAPDRYPDIMARVLTGLLAPA